MSKGKTQTMRFSDVQSGYTSGGRNIADRTVGKWLTAIGVTPNQVTLSGAFISLVGCVVWATQTHFPPAFWIGIGVVLLGTLSDLIDGSVARLSGKRTVFGSELDTLTDRVVEIGMFAALSWVLVQQHHEWGALGSVIALGGSLLVSFTRNVAEKLGLKGNVGIGARAERLVLLGIGVVAGHWIGYQWGIYAVGLLAWVTVMQRTLSIRRQLIAQGTP